VLDCRAHREGAIQVADAEDASHQVAARRHPPLLLDPSFLLFRDGTPG
jgi:hypothetical protein